jgi:hypothetical protein
MHNMTGRKSADQQLAADVASDARPRLQSHVKASHGVDMAWPVADCHLQDDFILMEGTPRRWYNPFQYYFPKGATQDGSDRDSLYLRLAKLWESPDDRILRFCQHYGLPRRVERERDASPLDSFEGRVEVAYPVWRVRCLARFLRAAIAAQQSVDQDDLSHVSGAMTELSAEFNRLGTSAAWVPGYPPTDACGRFHGRAIEVFWVGRPSDDLYRLALEWNVRWGGDELAGLTRSYWNEGFVLDRCGPHVVNYEGLSPEQIRTWIDGQLRAEGLFGDAEGRTHTSLESALVAMLVKDRVGVGRPRICLYCKSPFYARHWRQQYCPPGSDSGGTLGCAKLKADSKYSRKKR